MPACGEPAALQASRAGLSHANTERSADEIVCGASPEKKPSRSALSFSLFA
jgi:hypothetical protein